MIFHTPVWYTYAGKIFEQSLGQKALENSPWMKHN